MAREDGKIRFTFSADTASFYKDLNKLQADSRDVARKVAESIGNGFDKPLRDAFTSVNRNFKTAVESLKLQKVEINTDSLKDMSEQLGITTDKYKELVQRIAENNALKTAQEGFRKIAEQANLTQAEMQDLAREVGFTDDQFRNMRKEVEANEQQLRNLSKNDDFTNFAKRVVIATASVATLRKAVSLFSDTVKRIADIGDMAQAAGLRVEDFTKLSYIVEKSNGSVEAFSKSWLQLSKTVEDANSGNQEKLDAFARLGISLEEFQQMNPVEQFREIAEAISNLSTQGEKVQLTEKLFGRGGRELLTILQEGAEGVDELSTRFDKYGRSLSALDVTRAREADDAIDNLKDSWGSLADSVAIKATPALLEVSRILEGIINASDYINRAELETAPIEKFSSFSIEELEHIQKKAQETADELKSALEGAYLHPKLNKMVIDTAFGVQVVNEDVLERYNEAIERSAAASSRIEELKIEINAAQATEGLDKVNASLIDTQSEIEQTTNALAALNEVDFTSIIDQLQSELNKMKAGDDPFALWQLEYNKLLEQVKGNSFAEALLSEYDEVKRAQLELDKLTEEQLKADQAIADQIAESNKDLNTRLNLWQKIGFESTQAQADLNEELRQYEEELINANVAEEERLRAIQKRREEISKSKEVDQQSEKQEETETETEAPRGWQDGMKSAFDEYIKNAQDVAKQTEDLFNNAFKNMENGLVNFVKTGEFNFSSFIDSLIEDLIRMSIRQAILAPIFGAVNGLFSGGFGTGGASIGAGAGIQSFEIPKFHTGGIVGFQGFASNEVPAILQQGEGVFTADQMRHLSPITQAKVTVNVINNTNSEVKITQQQGANGEIKLTAVIDDAMAYSASKPSSAFSQALKTSKRLRQS